MRKSLGLAFALALFLAASVFAQERHAAPPRSPEIHTNGGHIPPAPSPRADRKAKPEGEKLQGGRVDKSQHVNNDIWYGHASANDKRFRLAHPFEHGRFEQFGSSFRYSVVRVDVHAHRFWFPGGFYFQVAAWDWGICANWCWTCADDFIIYEDSDHPGWYLLYDIETGAYVHVEYLGT
jgi:hypothetical protein